ncbi:MAG TPA: PBP1A family penicillin-binding protein [Candidatus Polarisedimenticolia bacterium]|nr:PBP1A family penicillin-binding protein [Candidatus Polarisedimenticolia bacterium]
MASPRRKAPKRKTGPSPRRLLFVWLPLGCGVVLAGALTIACIDANWRFSQQAPPPPVRVLSTAFAVREDMRLSREDLVERLKRLGYRQVEGRPATPGEYALRFRSFEIARNRFDGPDGPVEPLTVRVRLASRVGNVENADTGRDVRDFRLEPEPLGLLSGDAHEERLPTPLADIPPVLQHAVIAIEDRRFESHPGFDPLGILRALLANLRQGEVVQGGSTITQQLAKNLYHAQEHRTVPQKIWETLSAISLEMARTKQAILERYLNEVYLAQRGPMAIVGVGAAAHHYFGKDVRYVDLPEAALLAGLIQSPGRYHPYRHPDAARERRDLVLQAMREADFITEDERKAAAAAPLRLRPEPSHDPRQAPYFVDYVAEELQRLRIADQASSGLTVFTTLDPLLQARAEAALETRLAKDERTFRQLRPLPGGSLQGAVVALRPADGAVLAMVGGRDYGRSQFNRIAQAHRQPGSLFKPFVYLAGFQRAQEEGEPSFTPATVLDDSPFEEEVAGVLWAPHNFDEEFRGPVTARQALTHSLNVPTIRAAEQIGLREVIRAARRCGIESPLEPVPSIALGTFEVTPLEIAAAFTPFATGGERRAPRAIEAVVDGTGKKRLLPDPEHKTAATPQAAYLTLDLMRDVVRQGTAASIGAWGIQADLAGKTGTTDEERDAWFLGFNPDFLALAWVGFDNNRPLRLGGSALAVPIWADVAAGAGLDPQSRFEEPDGLIREDVDPTTGLRAGWRCPESINEVFIAGAEPVEACQHDRPITSWAKRLFHWLQRE